MTETDQASVMVVGDAMLDRYIFGEARRISREAPVPVLQIDREVAVAGGAIAAALLSTRGPGKGTIAPGTVSTGLASF